MKDSSKWWMVDEDKDLNNKKGMFIENLFYWTNNDGQKQDYSNKLSPNLAVRNWWKIFINKKY